MCSLCEETEYQNSSCGVGVNTYTNFVGEGNKDKSSLLEILDKEHQSYLEYLELVASLSRKKSVNNFALNEKDLHSALALEQDNLFGGILTQLKMQERKAREEENNKNIREINAGALK